MKTTNLGVDWVMLLTDPEKPRGLVHAKVSPPPPRARSQTHPFGLKAAQQISFLGMYVPSTELFLKQPEV